MFRKEDGPTALRADLLRGLSFSSRPEDIQIDDHSGSAVAGVSSVWNGSRGFVAVLIRFIEPPHVERYMYSEPLTDESMLALAQAEALRFAGAMGFSMDDFRFQELDDAGRAKRLLNWNLIRKVRLSSAPEQPLAAPENDAAVVAAPVGAVPGVKASNDEEAILLEPVDVYPDGDSTERFGSPIESDSPLLEPVEEIVSPVDVEPPEEITLEALFAEADAPTAPTAPTPSAPLIEPEQPGTAAEEPMVLEPMSASSWASGSEEGTVESEPFVIEAMELGTPVETGQPVEAAAEEVLSLESVVLEPVDLFNDDTPVSLDLNVPVPAREETGLVSPVSEPNVLEFAESADSEVVDVEPAEVDDLEQLHGEPMLEFSDEETIEAEIGGKGGFATARPGAVLGKVDLIRREGGDRRQISSLGRLLSFF